MNELMMLEDFHYLEKLKFIFLISLTLLTCFSIYYLIHIGNKHIEEKRRIQFERIKIKRILIYVLPIFLFIFLIYRYSLIRSIVGAFIFSLGFSVILNPMVNWFRKKGLKPAHSVILLYIIIFLLFIFVILMALPNFLSEVKKFVMSFDNYLDNIADGFETFVSRYNLNRFGIDTNRVNIDFSHFFKDFSFSDNLGRWFGSAMRRFTGLTSKFFSLFLILVFTFFILSEKDNLIELAIKYMPESFSREIDEYKELSKQINQTVVDFMKGRLLMAVFVGVATTILLLIMDIDFAFIIGIVTCIADIIPYVGPFLGFLPAVFFAFISSPMKALMVSIVFVIIQWVENNIIGPKVLSNGVGLHPLVILLCIIVGGNMFGVVGMIFAVPVVAIAYIVIKFFLDKKLRSRL